LWWSSWSPSRYSAASRAAWSVPSAAPAAPTPRPSPRSSSAPRRDPPGRLTRPRAAAVPRPGPRNRLPNPRAHPRAVHRAAPPADLRAPADLASRRRRPHRPLRRPASRRCPLYRYRRFHRCLRYSPPVCPCRRCRHRRCRHPRCPASRAGNRPQRAREAKATTLERYWWRLTL
jgi:hypothetical protein